MYCNKHFDCLKNKLPCNWTNSNATAYYNRAFWKRCQCEYGTNNPMKKIADRFNPVATEPSRWTSGCSHCSTYYNEPRNYYFTYNPDNCGNCGNCEGCARFRNEIFTNEGFRNEIFADEIFRDQIFRDEIFRNEIFQDEVIRNEILRNEVIMDERFIGDRFNNERFRDEIFSDQGFRERIFRNEIFRNRIFETERFRQIIFRNERFRNVIFRPERFVPNGFVPNRFVPDALNSRCNECNKCTDVGIVFRMTTPERDSDNIVELKLPRGGTKEMYMFERFSPEFVYENRFQCATVPAYSNLHENVIDNRKEHDFTFSDQAALTKRGINNSFFAKRLVAEGKLIHETNSFQVPMNVVGKAPYYYLGNGFFDTGNTQTGLSHYEISKGYFR
jgi:hypothetical protein